MFGYNGFNSRNNLKFNKQGYIVYYTAAIAIVLEFDNLDKEVQLKKQHYFNHHTEEITCLDLHSDQVRVATGQQGPDAKVFVWDSTSMKKLCTFEGYFRGGVSNVSFSSNRRLAVSTIDEFNEIFIFDIVTQSPKGGIFITSIKTGILPITQIAWNF